MNIAELIPVGRKYAISRARLRRLTGLNDSAMRGEIAKARRETCILNLQDGNGYFKPDNKEDVARYIAQEEHRAKSIFMNLRGAKKYYNEIAGQMVFDIEEDYNE